MLRIALLLVVFLPGPTSAQEDMRQIVVSAEGSVQAIPDMATVTVGVSREQPTASEAMQAMASAAQAVFEDVTSAGIEARDVQTSSISLNPVWNAAGSRPAQIRGYAAATMVTVRVRELDALGALLDSVVGKGANQLNGLNFGIADSAPLEREARTNAVREARAKAETLAEAAGVVLGPVQSIMEGGAARAPAPMMRGAMVEAAAVPIASGELDVRISVTVTYAIAE
ncbi:MAG: SIMPL domain-containing protein [Pseudomonadota bacterium]